MIPNAGKTAIFTPGMKTLLQKIHISESESFACRYYRTPQFETGWHKHPEYELIVLPEGYGTVLAGDYVGPYGAGDVFFLAGNLPHAFRKQHEKMTGCALVAQFTREVVGPPVPELQGILNLLYRQDALQLHGQLQQQVAEALRTIAGSQGYTRWQLLLQCLHLISTSDSYTVLSRDFEDLNHAINPAIEAVFAYTLAHYLQPVTLPEVAALAHLTVPAFCRFFKKNVKKTYFDFLQELRISHACKLLQSTQLPVLQVCYESGFNSWAHFSKKFRELKHMPPGKYRKLHQAEA